METNSDFEHVSIYRAIISLSHIDKLEIITLISAEFASFRIVQLFLSPDIELQEAAL